MKIEKLKHGVENTLFSIFYPFHMALQTERYFSYTFQGSQVQITAKKEETRPCTQYNQATNVG